MQSKDTSEKLLTNVNEVFADIFNALCCDGKKVIDETKLSNAQTTNAYIYKKETRNIDSDVSKLYNEANLTIAMLNIENQSHPDKDMPLRIFGYEGAKYNSQIISRKKERYPIITLVLNFDTEKRWNTPLKLKECLNNKLPKELDSYINDFKINVIDVAFMSKEKIDKLNSDFKVIADYFYQLKNIGDYKYPSKTELKYPTYTMYTMAAITNDMRFNTAYNEFEEENKGEVITMESYLDRIIAKGKAVGMIEGETKGKFDTLTDNIKALISKNFTFDQSCDLLDVDEETRNRLIDTGEFIQNN